jgi:hypothetical protein
MEEFFLSSKSSIAIQSRTNQRWMGKSKRQTKI